MPHHIIVPLLHVASTSACRQGAWLLSVVKEQVLSQLQQKMAPQVRDCSHCNVG